MDRGYLISFEGLDGCGKTTQIQRLTRTLESTGRTVCLVREPGGTPLGEKIRELLIDKVYSDMTDMTELLLFCASRAQLYNTVILPKLKAGHIVLCDRFLDSTVAYQSFGRGIKLEFVQAILDQVLLNQEPDITFFLDLPVEDIHKRIKQRQGQMSDRLEAEDIDFKTRVREGYLYQAKMNPKRIIKIDALNTREELEKIILEKANEVIK